MKLFAFTADMRSHFSIIFFGANASIKQFEIRPVLLSFACFFFLFFSYAVIKPVRDTMGTVWGTNHLQELFLATFLLSFAVAPLYASLSSRVKLSNFLPWLYGAIAFTVFAFCLLFSSGLNSNKWLAGSFFVWVSTFNLLILSVFWSLMADLFSRGQANRLFGFIAAGGTLGNILGPITTDLLVTRVGNNVLMLISAFGFMATAGIVVLLERVKSRLIEQGYEGQKTTLDHRLTPDAFEGFKEVFSSSRYLLLIAAFLFVMTSVSTIVYVQLNEMITHSFASREARTQAFAQIDIAVNSGGVLVQLFGTGRIIQRFGVTFGLMLNPIIMVIAFVAVFLAPALIVLGTVQVIRRVAEYAIAKPAREMLFTIVDQQSKYRAKNVIDTVIYRGGDLLAATASSTVLTFGMRGLAVLGGLATIVWFPIAYFLGNQYEKIGRQEGDASTFHAGGNVPGE